MYLLYQYTGTPFALGQAQKAGMSDIPISVE
jgi:hypothetical protein